MSDIRLSDIQRTGSVSQDALRLGFQTTCRSGIEKLLKVDALTVEACEDFRERHTLNIQRGLECLPQEVLSEHNRKFRNNMLESFVSKDNSFFHFLGDLTKNLLFGWTLKKQSVRKIEVLNISTDPAELDLYNGRWRTTVHYNKKKHSWSGYYKGVRKVFDEEIEACSNIISTDAAKCNVEYIEYDKFHDTYVPDEAARAAFEAVSIGMTKLMVARPRIDRGGVKRDPIIVGHVDNQMFIIAWFGYDKTNHMSCNV